MTKVSKSVEIICCYSYADETGLREQAIHLNLLQRQDFISLWLDRLIDLGTVRGQAIDSCLETASVILLVSTDFFASDYYCDVDRRCAIPRQETDKSLIIPILVSPVDWNDALFAHLLLLLTSTNLKGAWKSQKMAFADVTASIRRIIEGVLLLSVSAPEVVLPRIWTVLCTRNFFFLRCVIELVWVLRHWRGDKATPPLTTTGDQWIEGHRQDLVCPKIYCYH